MSAHETIGASRHSSSTPKSLLDLGRRNQVENEKSLGHNILAQTRGSRLSDDWMPCQATNIQWRLAKIQNLIESIVQILALRLKRDLEQTKANQGQFIVMKLKSKLPSSGVHAAKSMRSMFDSSASNSTMLISVRGCRPLGSPV